MESPFDVFFHSSCVPPPLLFSSPDRLKKRRARLCMDELLQGKKSVEEVRRHAHVMRMRQGRGEEKRDDCILCLL